MSLMKRLDLYRYLRRQKYIEVALKGLLTAEQSAICVKRAKMELENPALQSEDETLYASGQQIKIDENQNKEIVSHVGLKTSQKVVPQKDKPDLENAQKIHLSEQRPV